jgi:hypothetical protein
MEAVKVNYGIRDLWLDAGGKPIVTSEGDVSR